MLVLSRRDPTLRREAWRNLAARSGYHPGQLAAICDISVRQLERYFAEDFQTTPQAWLNQERMQSARALLDGADSIKGVAYALGFKHPSHFTREFKRFHGKSPTEYLRSRAS